MKPASRNSRPNEKSQPPGQAAAPAGQDPELEQLPMPFSEPQEHFLSPALAQSPVYLPAWAETKRGIPNAVLRGALFPAIQGRNRKYLKNIHIRTQQDIEIHFTGEQLNQTDLNTWEYAIHLARQSPLGDECEFSAYSFLKALNRTTGKSDHEWLRESLGRLSGGLVSITHGDFEYFGSLIHSGIRNRRTGHYRLKLNPDLISLYTAGYWTAINWSQRHQLRRKPLALWLHGYYASHAQPYPLRVATLRDMSGSNTKHLGRFKKALAQALDELQTTGAIDAWDIRDNLVYVSKTTAPKNARKPHNA